MALQSTTALATITLQTAATEITFSSIPNTYRDLVAVVSGIPNANVASGAIRINGDTGSNYLMVGMRGNGSNAASYTTSTVSGWFDYAGDSVANSTTLCSINFLDYAATDKHKAFIARQSNAADTVEAMAQRWASTSAITSLTFYWTTGGFAAGSTISLYGRIA